MEGSPNPYHKKSPDPSTTPDSAPLATNHSYSPLQCPIPYFFGVRTRLSQGTTPEVWSTAVDKTTLSPTPFVEFVKNRIFQVRVSKVDILVAPRPLGTRSTENNSIVDVTQPTTTDGVGPVTD